MYNPAAPMKGVPVEFMTAQTVLNTLSTVLVPGVGIRNHTITLIGNLSVAGVGLTGALQLETADAPDAVDAWAQFLGGPIDLSTMQVTAAGTKSRLELQVSNVVLNALRGRISTVVAGGTLSLVYNGQG